MAQYPRPQQSFKARFIGNRAFYGMVLAVVLPIIVQNAITNFVSLLDNIMVGRVGTEQMSGVAIANQLLFVFNMCVFGGIAGAGIFAAQYFGAGNHEGVRECFRYKIYLSLGLVVAAIAVLLSGGEVLIRKYLTDAADAGRVEVTLQHGMNYLHIMMWGLLPFALTQTYAGTLRETGETALPMKAGIAAVLVNLLFNYILIYGKFGAPAMGVEGAALATVISRFVELGIVMYVTHTHPERFPFIKGVYRSGRISGRLAREITIKGLPLMVNEALWSLGMATLSQCYSLRGLDVVAAMNISSTVSNLFSVVFLSLGNATAIIVGQSLGANDMKTAVDHAWKLIAFSVSTCLITSLVMAAAAPLVPYIYNTADEVRHLATRLLLVYAMCMPLFAYANCAYFILRSGGKTMITFVSDCAFSWVVSIPLAWSLVNLTGLHIVSVYLCVQLADFIKCVFGHILVKKGVWINNMVQ